ncbi:transposase [Clostridium sp.]|uniref:transposase n=1 Tax=Clostridium sp. TaxID=1506 RepID=UPI00387EBB3C
MNDKFNKNFLIVENTVKSKLLNEILEFLNTTKLPLNIEFVYDRGKRKTELQKLIEEANKYLKRQSKYENIIADIGYEGEENYVYLEKNNQKSFIKPQNYENMKSKKFKNNIGKRENMIYNEITDTYTCANNKELKFIATTTRKSKSGYISKVKIYECENCNNCPIKSKCTKAKGNKKIQVSPVFITKRKQSQNNITSEFGILARMNRSIQVEGAFGVIKENHNFRRFLTRGKKNVKVEFTLLALAYNLNKLHNKIQQNRLGVTFYTKAIA